MLRSLFRKNRVDFLELLLAQAVKAEEGMQTLHAFFADANPALGETLEQQEAQADALRRHLVYELNRSFVTPFDREDIFALSRAIDDVIDYAKSTVEEMMLFGVHPNDQLRRMGDVLLAASKEITAAVRVMKKDPTACTEYCIRAKKNENVIEHYYRQALAELFCNPDVVYILKMREIYRHLSNAADRGDEAANIIGDIVVKST